MAISDYIYFNFSDKSLKNTYKKSLRDMVNLIQKFEFYLHLIYTLLNSIMKIYETTKFIQSSAQLDLGPTEPILGNKFLLYFLRTPTKVLCQPPKKTFFLEYKSASVKIFFAYTCF